MSQAEPKRSANREVTEHGQQGPVSVKETEDGPEEKYRDTNREPSASYTCNSSPWEVGS